MNLPNQLIHDIREDRDIKQQTIANLLGVSQQQYARRCSKIQKAVFAPIESEKIREKY